MFLNKFRTKFPIEQLPYNSIGFVSIKSGSFAICKDLIIDEMRGVKGWRILLNLNNKYSRTIEGEYVLPIIKRKGRVVDFYEIYFDPKFSKQVKTEEGTQNSHPLTSKLYDLIVKISNSPKYILIYDEIIAQKNKKKGKNWTFLILFPFHQQVPFPLDKDQIFFNPEEMDIIELVDFSKTNFNLKPSKDAFYYGKSSDEIKNDFNFVLDNSNIKEELKTEFIANFNLNILAENLNLSGVEANKLIRKKFSNGMILYGPPGTGKTHIIKEYIIEIFKKFGFETISVKLPDILGSKDSAYIGAPSRAVRRIFKPVIEKVIKTQKPCFIFVDEADKVIETGNQSVDMMKNYINPESYPGLIMCFNTNLEGGIDRGLIERRLSGVEYDFPNFKISKNIWILKIKNLFENEEINNFSDENYDLLANLTAGNVGLDSIDTFCKQYRTKTNTSLSDSINIEEFILSYVENTLTRIETEKTDKLSSYSKLNHYVDKDELENLKKKYDNQKRKLINSLKGETESDIDKKTKKVISGLQISGPSNLYYKNYLELITFYAKLDSENLDLNLLKQIFDNLIFLIENLGPAQVYFTPELLNSPNFVENFENNLTKAKQFVSDYLISIGNRVILLQIPELIGVEIKNSDLVALKKFFLINFRDFLNKLSADNLFKFNTSQNNSTNKNFLTPLMNKDDPNVIDAQIIPNENSKISKKDQNIVENIENTFDWINSNFNILGLMYMKKYPKNFDINKFNTQFNNSLNYLFQNMDIYFNSKNIEKGLIGGKLRKVKKDISNSILIINNWKNNKYITSTEYSTLTKFLLEIIELKK